MKKKNVIFRRYKGRIIPINLTKKQKQYAQGGGLIAGSLGVTALGGYSAAKLVQGGAVLKHYSKGYYKTAKGHGIQHDMFKSNKWFTSKIGKKLLKNPLQSSKYIRYAAQKVFALRNPVLAGATILGSALLSAGVHKTYTAKTGKKFETKGSVGSDVFSAAIGGVTALAYYKFIPTAGKLKLKDAFKHAFARQRGVPRPKNISIKHSQGTLRFD